MAKCRRPWPTLNTKNIEGMGPYADTILTVGGEKLTVADKFTYLGSTLSRTVTINEGVNYSFFGRL